MNMDDFEKKHPYFWLILGLILTMFSYGIFNTGICAWIFAIPLIRFINNRTNSFISSAGIWELKESFLTMRFLRQ